MVARRERERDLTGRSQVDLVVARLQIRAEGAQELRLVVDDEDPRHCAALRRNTIVSPPPGVSSISTSPPIASTNPFATARPSPDSVAATGVAEPLKREEDGLTIARRHAGATIHDAHVDGVARCARDDPHPLARRAVVEGVDDHVGQRALEEPGVGEDPRVSLVDVDVYLGGPCADARKRSRDDLVDPDRREADLERPGLKAAHVEQVADEIVEPVRLLVDREEELMAGLRRPLDVLLEQARHRRLDPRQRRSQIVRDGRQDRRAKVACGGEGSCLGRLRR